MKRSPSALGSRKAGRKPVIYLVDDEPVLLEFAEMSLAGRGWTLKKFRDPGHASRMFAREKTKPTLLLTDYAMKPINGLELASRCRRVHPTLKVILASGTVGPEVAQSAGIQVDGFLQKPFLPPQLLDKVREILRK